jgi:cobalt-zinc-cadmium efflux system outer membrane protein
MRHDVRALRAFSLRFERQLSALALAAIGWLGTSTPAAAAQAPDSEDALAREVTLGRVLALALARNPQVLAEDERARAAEDRTDAAGRLPDVALKYEVWSVPFARPLAFDQAMMHMVGLRQTFPAFGSRAAESRLAEAESGAVRATAAARAEEVVAEVRRRFAELQRLEEETHVLLEHAGVLSRLVEVASASYRVGGDTLQDQLRLDAELARLHGQIATVMEQRKVAAAALSALAGRDPAIPLGAPSDRPPPPPAAVNASAEESSADGRPELVAAARDVDRAAATLEAARRKADYPELMVGLDYMNQPTQPDQHGYGAMLTMSLPWLNPGRRAYVRTAERSLVAARHDLASTSLTARFEAVAAAERYRAAKEVLLLEDMRALPAARQSYELAQKTYGTRRVDLTVLLDAERAYLGARIDRARAAASLATAAADLDRAAGSGRAFAERLLSSASGSR